MNLKRLWFIPNPDWTVIFIFWCRNIYNSENSFLEDFKNPYKNEVNTSTFVEVLFFGEMKSSYVG